MSGWRRFWRPGSGVSQLVPGPADAQTRQALRPGNRVPCCEAVGKASTSLPLRSPSRWSLRCTPVRQGGPSHWPPHPTFVRSSFCVFPTPAHLGWWSGAYSANQPLRVRSQVLGPGLAKGFLLAQSSKCPRPSPSCPLALLSTRYWQYQLKWWHRITSPGPHSHACGSVVLALFRWKWGQRGEQLAWGSWWARGPPVAWIV